VVSVWESVAPNISSFIIIISWHFMQDTTYSIFRYFMHVYEKWWMAYGKTVSIIMRTLLNPKYNKMVSTCGGVERNIT
jgi:hypothetical protein